MLRKHARSFTAILAFALGAPLAHAAKEPPAVAKARAEALKDFVAACVAAFRKSQGDGVTESANELCQCTADEAGEEKIPPDRLRAETARIAQDPKYQIQDKLLLQSFHVCTADAMIDADRRSKEQKK